MPTIDVLLDGHNLNTKQGSVGFCSVVLIEGKHRTVVDVGHVGRKKPLLAALAERGLTPQDIDFSVMTHAHWDHAQSFDVFDHAPMLIHNWERRYAHDPHVNDWATPRWSGAMIETQSNIMEVEDGHELEPGVRVLHTPGHSPGSISILVDTDDGVGAITSDVLHYGHVALTRQNPAVFWNEEDARRSIDRILELSDVIYPGHDRPFRLIDGERIEFLQPMKLEIVGVDPNDPGLTWSSPSYDETPPPVWIMPGIESQRVPG